MLRAKERRLETASNNVRFAAERVENFNSEIEAARLKADALVIQVQELHNARSNMEYLMKMIFDQPAWGSDSMLSTLKYEAKELEDQLEDTSELLDTHGKGRSLLSSANKKIDKALAALRSSRLLAGLSDNSEFPLDPANLTRAQILALRQANDSAKSAVEDFGSAGEYVNDLPYDNDEVLFSARNGVFSEVLEQDALENEESLDIIRRGLEIVKDLHEGLQQSLEWTRQKMQAYEMGIERVRTSVKDKNDEIVMYQHSQVKAAATVGGLVSSNYDMDY